MVSYEYGGRIQELIMDTSAAVFLGIFLFTVLYFFYALYANYKVKRKFSKSKIKDGWAFDQDTESVGNSLSGKDSYHPVRQFHEPLESNRYSSFSLDAADPAPDLHGRPFATTIGSKFIGED